MLRACIITRCDCLHSMPYSGARVLLTDGLFCRQVAIFAGPYPRFQADTYNDGAEDFTTTCGQLPTCVGTPENAQGTCSGTCNGGVCEDSSGGQISVCVDGVCSNEYGFVSSCTQAFSQTGYCPEPLGCTYIPPDGIAAVAEACEINSELEACRPGGNPWGTFTTVADEYCDSLLTTGDQAACETRAAAAVVGIAIAADEITLAAADATIAAGMKLQIHDADGRTCSITPKDTDLRVATVTDATIAFTVDLLTEDSDPATNCVVTGSTGCSYTPAPSPLKPDPADPDPATCEAIQGETSCDANAACVFNPGIITAPFCGSTADATCAGYGITVTEGGPPNALSDHAAGGACVADAQCEYIDGGTTQQCVATDEQASQEVQDACTSAAVDGAEACAAAGACTYRANDVSDDSCVAATTATCSAVQATCTQSPTRVAECAALNSDAVACNAHASCTYDGTLSTCGMTTSPGTCTAEAASGEAACTGAGTVAGDCDYNTLEDLCAADSACAYNDGTSDDACDAIESEITMIDTCTLTTPAEDDSISAAREACLEGLPAVSATCSYVAEVSPVSPPDCAAVFAAAVTPTEDTCPAGCTFEYDTRDDKIAAGCSYPAAPSKPPDNSIPPGCIKQGSTQGACNSGAPYLTKLESNKWSIAVTLVVVPAALDLSLTSVEVLAGTHCSLTPHHTPCLPAVMLLNE